MMSKHTKLVQSKENKNKFLKFNILFKKRVSIIKIKIKNLNKIKDLKTGRSLNGQLWIFSFNKPGLKNWIVVDKKKYKKKIIKSQHVLLNL